MKGSNVVQTVEMTVENHKCGPYACRSYQSADPAFLIIQPVGDHDIGILDDQIDWMTKNTTDAFHLTAVKVNDWNNDLSPWEAPAAFGEQGFGQGAAETLSFIEKDLIPELRDHYGIRKDAPVILGGYSLAGLFSLWSAYQTDSFCAVSAVTPSVWFPGWIEYASSHAPQTEIIYLSLGRKEEKTKNRLMSGVGDCIRKQDHLLSEQEHMKHVLEWNEGNHFREPDIRCAKGLLWCMRELKNAITKST